MSDAYYAEEDWAADEDEVEDEVEDAEVEDADDEDADDGLALLLQVDEYLAADRSGRIATWASLDDEERTAFAAAGVVGPVTVSVGEDFELIEPTDPHYAATMQTSAATLKQGLGYIRNDDLDVTEELAAALEELHEVAEAYPEPHPKRTKAVQLGAYLVEAAIAAAKDAIPFDPGNIRLTEQGTDRQGRTYTRQVDRRGKVREHIHTEEELAADELADAEPTTPWSGRVYQVDVEEFMAWDQATQYEFAKAHPSVLEAMGDSLSDSLGAWAQ